MSDTVVDPSFSPHTVFQLAAQATGAEEDVAEPPGARARRGPCLCQGAQPLPWLPKSCPGEAAALTQISFAVIKHPLPWLTSKRSGLPASPRTVMNAGSINQQTPAFITPTLPEMNFSFEFFSFFFFLQPTKPNHPHRSINNSGVATQCPSHVPSFSPGHPAPMSSLPSSLPPTQPSSTINDGVNKLLSGGERKGAGEEALQGEGKRHSCLSHQATFPFLLLTPLLTFG